MKHEDKTFLRFTLQSFNILKDLDTFYNAFTETIDNTELIQVKKKIYL